MFWNMDVGEQEQDLMEISHFLLSVFEFAKNQPGNVFQKEDWLDFSPENGTGFTGCMSVIQIMERICAVLWTGSFAWTRKSGKKFTKQ